MLFFNAIENIIGLLKLTQIKDMAKRGLFLEVLITNVFMYICVDLNVRSSSIEKSVKIDKLLNKTITMKKKGIFFPRTNFVE